jgi:hypothetical protein
VPAGETQSLCETGQEQLMRLDYLAAQQTLEQAERLALEARDYDALARLYMPLQETRRQIRQRCGEGVVRLDLLARDADDRHPADTILRDHPQGQLLVAGWGSIQPAVEVRRQARQRKLFVETFLAAVYPASAVRVVAIVPLDGALLPEPVDRPIDQLIKLLPAHTIVVAESELPRGATPGDWKTFSKVMNLWEQLHQPFLAAADSQPDLAMRIEDYRKTIAVDSACELAHQRLADTARRLSRAASA